MKEEKDSEDPWKGRRKQKQELDKVIEEIEEKSRGVNMSDRRHHKHLTPTEVKRYDALAHFDSVKAAAIHLGLSPQTLYNWMSQIKKRYKKRRGWINSTMAQARRGGCLKNLLKERKIINSPEVVERARRKTQEKRNLRQVI